MMSHRPCALGPIRHFLTDYRPSGILPYDTAKLKETWCSAQPGDGQTAELRLMRSDPTKDIDERVGSAPIAKKDAGDKNLSRECWRQKT